MSLAKVLKFILPFLFTFFVIAVFFFTKIQAVKFYPVLMNFIFFCVFFSSIFAKETVIQKIARFTDGKLDEPVFTYTKNLTYVWIVFLFINFLISLRSLFMSDEFWALYNGCISYILVGIMFGSELIVRYFFKKRHGI